MKRWYVAGPMSGLPSMNYPAFHAAAAKLRAMGHHVENPAENPEPPCGTWAGWMRMSIRQLSHCDCVLLLPGWYASKGALVETFIALVLGLQIVRAKS